jgi:hypothetical protein
VNRIKLAVGDIDEISEPMLLRKLLDALARAGETLVDIGLKSEEVVSKEVVEVLLAQRIAVLVSLIMPEPMKLPY